MKKKHPCFSSAWNKEDVIALAAATEKKTRKKTPEWLIPVKWRWLSWWCFTEICTVCAHIDNKHAMTHAATLQNKKISISCYVQPPWRMLSCFRSISTSQCWWQQPLPHSCFLSSDCEKKHTHKNTSLFFFFLSPQNKIHLLTAAGARESLSSCVSVHGCTSKFPAYFLLPASRWRCSAHKQLTASTILWSHDLGHYQIRAITCYNSSLPQQLPGAVQLSGAIGCVGCVCVSLLSSTGGDKLCMCSRRCVITPHEECGTAINAWQCSYNILLALRGKKGAIPVRNENSVNFMCW